jgi:phage tail protein X
MNNEDFYEEDDDLMIEFLIDETPDIDLLWMPKLDHDIKAFIDKFYKKIKKCRNKDQLTALLYKYYGHIANIAVLQHEIRGLQDKAKGLEINIEIMKQEEIID